MDGAIETKLVAPDLMVVTDDPGPASSLFPQGAGLVGGLDAKLGGAIDRWLNAMVDGEPPFDPEGVSAAGPFVVVAYIPRTPEGYLRPEGPDDGPGLAIALVPPGPIRVGWTPDELRDRGLEEFVDHPEHFLGVRVVAAVQPSPDGPAEPDDAAAGQVWVIRRRNILVDVPSRDVIRRRG